MAQIVLENISKRFGEFKAVDGVTLNINDGEFVVLLGPSGCGKTTTLRMIAGLETVTSGDILIDGRRVNHLKASERDIAFVFQLFALYPHLTVYENIAFPLEAQHFKKPEIRERVHQAARLLQIEHILKAKPRALSGGDLQRVALARAIVRRPKAFLMDEPIGTLDAKFREDMRAELKRLHIDIHATTIYVTHDQIEAMSMGDKIVIMHQGKIQQVGSPLDVYRKPDNLFVAGFIGSPGMNFIPAMLRTGDENKIEFAGSVSISMPVEFQNTVKQGQHSGSEIIVGIRPEDVLLNEDGALNGEVYVVEPYGSYNIVDIKIDDTIIKARTIAAHKPAIGENVRFQFKHSALHLFRKNDGKALHAI
ncbi:ABC transporter ATP-binding protein [candidate division KSB1 bacterium]|nr:ABC transporter ATP-binding protein [candidate division KSB1 bacterium]